MGSTTVEFHDSGFEASDGTLQVWLHFLVAEIDRLPQASPWLKEVRDEWELQSTAGFDFGVIPDLDQFVTTEEQSRTILSLSESALTSLQQRGETIPKDDLNRMHLGGEGSAYLDDVPVEAFLRVGKYFVKLLHGDLSPAENDARLWKNT